MYCNFKVQRYKHGAYVTLQSMKHRGVFIGLSTNGKARPTVDTGDINTQFFPEVIKCNYFQILYIFVHAFQILEILKRYIRNTI